MTKMARTDFSLCLVCQKRKSEAQSKPKRESLIKLMTYLQKYKQHGDTEYTAIYYRLRNVTVDLMLQSQGFYNKDCYSNIVNILVKLVKSDIKIINILKSELIHPIASTLDMNNVSNTYIELLKDNNCTDIKTNYKPCLK